MDTSLFDALLPPDTGLSIRHISIHDQGIMVDLLLSAATSTCPNCGGQSSSIHGRYARTLRAEPCLGHTLTFDVTARKFACRTPGCPRRVFCERIPELAKSSARTTADLADSHRAIGMALGGEAGSRLAARLSIPTSPDTILRRVKSMAEEPTPPPRYVGIDDGALRKGHTYGTILIDLERRRGIDILPGRDGEALKAWLAANPQGEVITRDRWPAYIEAATEAAPQARQVADRFHLLRNVRKAVENILSGHAPRIRAAASDVDDRAVLPTAATESPLPDVASESPSIPAENSLEPDSAKCRQRRARRRAREERFGQVKELSEQGLSCRNIARRLGMSVQTVLSYRRLDVCPDWDPGRPRPNQLGPYSEQIAGWVGAGNRNAADLYRLLRKEGYRGGYDAVSRHLRRQIGTSGRPGPRGRDPVVPRPPFPSARGLSFRLLTPKPESRSARILVRMRESDPSLNVALTLAEELAGMIRREVPTILQEWSAKVEGAGLAGLKGLASSLLGDAKAVGAALTQDGSNGQVEGPINRLKAMKRPMYGRAGMPLLRARVKHKG